MKEYILKERIKIAQNQLRYSNASVSAIAEKLCFCSQSYFGHKFKQYIGYTPTEYRKLFYVDGTKENIEI